MNKLSYYSFHVIVKNVVILFETLGKDSIKKRYTKEKVFSYLLIGKKVEKSSIDSLKKAKTKTKNYIPNS